MGEAADTWLSLIYLCRCGGLEVAGWRRCRYHSVTEKHVTLLMNGDVEVLRAALPAGTISSIFDKTNQTYQCSKRSHVLL